MHTKLKPDDPLRDWSVVEYPLEALALRLLAMTALDLSRFMSMKSVNKSKIGLTLTEFIAYKIHEATHMILVEGDAEPREIAVPIQPEVLDYFKRVIWPKVYYDYQTNLQSLQKIQEQLMTPLVRKKAQISKGCLV